MLATILYAINDARLAVGKKPIGFINPAVRIPDLISSISIDIYLLQLYSDFFKGSYHDITNGTNPGCGTDGFSAVPGWDPVTGLGTPKFPVLLAKWLLLP